MKAKSTPGAGSTAHGNTQQAGGGQPPIPPHQGPTAMPGAVPPMNPSNWLKLVGMQHATQYLGAFLNSGSATASFVKKALAYGTAAVTALGGLNFVAHKGIELAEGGSDRNPGQVPTYWLGKMYYQGGLDWDPKNGSLTAENIEHRTMIGDGSTSGPAQYAARYQKLEHDGVVAKGTDGKPLTGPDGKPMRSQWVPTPAAKDAFKAAQATLKESFETDKAARQNSADLEIARTETSIREGVASTYMDRFKALEKAPAPE